MSSAVDRLNRRAGSNRKGPDAADVGWGALDGPYEERDNGSDDTTGQSCLYLEHVVSLGHFDPQRLRSFVIWVQLRYELLEDLPASEFTACMAPIL